MKMRVTGGSRRGLVLQSGDLPGVRPTKSMVREAVFSILGRERLAGATVVDLFAGSGIMGIEALSRGAASLWAVDRQEACCRQIRENLQRADFAGQSRVSCLTAEKFIFAQEVSGNRFDLVFMDPPYQYQARNRLVRKIAAGGLLTDGGILIVEHDRRGTVEFPENLTLWKKKRYGHSCLTLLVNQVED